MVVIRKNFPELISDNEELYFRMISGVIESVDELSSLEISKISGGVYFRLSPSLPKYSNPLIEELLRLNNLFGIRVDMGKSIKTSGVISFKITQ